eukprot:TRINITY_DN113851_c0_g1_i1.p1 TRINITY_DN113851_c0_g1~~TRINITY_DN113851_c0_g1_i1.p1  ORF type:complete len:317 (+),score=46.97 TRINITY_DN113851_c0_g1_i1:87-1037(+)
MTVVLGDPPRAPPREDVGMAQGTTQVSYVPQAARCEAQVGRPGGRRNEETRPCNLRVGAVPNASGSAYIEQGGTKIIAAVYGPRPAVERSQKAGRAEGLLNIDLSFAPFSSRINGKEENEKRVLLYNSILQGCLESVVLLDRYAKTAFDVSLMVLEDDGGVLTASLAAASLALSDAKVETRDLIAGATVHLVGSSASGSGSAPGSILLDCDSKEEQALPPDSSVLHLGLCPSRGSVCLFHSAGPLPPKPLEQMVLVAKDTAAAVGAEMRRCLEKRVERRVAKRARSTSADMAIGGGEGGEDGDDMPVLATFDDGYG